MPDLDTLATWTGYTVYAILTVLLAGGALWVGTSWALHRLLIRIQPRLSEGTRIQHARLASRVADSWFLIGAHLPGRTGVIVLGLGNRYSHEDSTTALTQTIDRTLADEDDRQRGWDAFQSRSTEEGPDRDR